MVIEVVSPSDRDLDVIGKVREYFDAGVRQAWVVFPDVRQVYVYRSPKQAIILGDGDELDGGDLLPLFRLPLAELFEDGAEV